jgi:hypothetical protein
MKLDELYSIMTVLVMSFVRYYFLIIRHLEKNSICRRMAQQ